MSDFDTGGTAQTDQWCVDQSLERKNPSEGLLVEGSFVSFTGAGRGKETPPYSLRSLMFSWEGRLESHGWLGTYI